MLLRNSISNTKKFFQKTIDNFKSFLSKGNSTYERLPKTPPFNPFSCGGTTHKEIETGYKDLDNFYSEFTHQWDTQKGKLKTKGEKISSHKPTQNTHQFHKVDPPRIKIEAEKNDKFTKESMNDEYKRSDDLKSKISNVNIRLMKKQSDICSRSVREKKLSSVAQKLKELEMMDKGNVDHKLDVDEILHYYSRLTCPAFLDIVDRFFMEVCVEFSGSLKG